MIGYLVGDLGSRLSVTASAPCYIFQALFSFAGVGEGKARLSTNQNNLYGNDTSSRLLSFHCKGL